MRRNKHIVRLTESDVRRVIRNSVKRILSENDSESSVANIESALRGTDMGDIMEKIFDNHPELITVMAEWLADNVGEEQLKSEWPGYDYFVDSMDN